MAPVFVDPGKIHAFVDSAAFERWLAIHHDREVEVWIKLHKKGSGLASITPTEAIDVCLCWGWIDAIRKSFDDRSFLQRYTRRGRRSVWSQINVDNVARLIASGRMTPHGLAHVEAAKADGRWGRAYASGRSMTTPDDLARAIAASPRAQATYRRLDRANLFAMAFRVGNLKTAAGRAAKVEAYVAMLARGESLLPMKQPKAEATTPSVTANARATAKAGTKAKATAKAGTRAKATKPESRRAR